MESNIDYKTFYVTWYSRSKAFALGYVRDESEAENIVQEVFVNIYERRRLLSGDFNLTSYLFSSVKNRCISYLRDKVRNRTSYMEDCEAECLDKLNLEALEQFDVQFSDENAIEIRLKKALDILPERCRQIFILNKIEGRKQKEIAEDLGISVNTVESQMAIAYKKLREEFADCLPFFLFFIGVI